MTTEKTIRKIRRMAKFILREVSGDSISNTALEQAAHNLCELVSDLTGNAPDIYVMGFDAGKNEGQVDGRAVVFGMLEPSEN